MKKILVVVALLVVLTLVLIENKKIKPNQCYSNGEYIVQILEVGKEDVLLKLRYVEQESFRGLFITYMALMSGNQFLASREEVKEFNRVKCLDYTDVFEEHKE